MGEESKSGDAEYDDAKVSKILKIVQPAAKQARPCKAGPAGQDFRAFLKQQRMQAQQPEEAASIALKEPGPKAAALTSTHQIQNPSPSEDQAMSTVQQSEASSQDGPDHAAGEDKAMQ